MAKDSIDANLAKFLKQAKSKERNFVLLFKGTNCFKLIVDKKKISSAVINDARKETKVKNVCNGLCVGDGSDMLFKVLEEPSVSVAKLKNYITENSGLSLKPRFVIVEEIIEVDEIGEDTDDPTEEAASADAAEAPEAPATPEVDPAKKQQFRDALVKVVPPVQRTLKSPDVPADVKTELQGLVAQLKADVAENRFDEAKLAVAKIVPIVKEHAPAADSAKADAKPGGAVDYAKARLAWNAAHNKAKTEFAKLKSAMLAQCAESPEELAPYRDAVLAMDDLMGPFESNLSDLLDQALNAELPNERQQLHDQAAGLIRKKVEALESSEFLQATDSNPVMPVPVYSTLSITLKTLATTIS